MVATALLAATGCSSTSEGTVDVTVWGEEYIEEGIPEAEFVDGWSVTFSKFLIVVGDVHIRGAEQDAPGLPGAVLYDLVRPGPQSVGGVGAVAGSYEDVGFAIAPASAATTAGEGVTDADLAAMADAGASVWLEGTATGDGGEKSFAWAFDVAVQYARCVDLSGGQEKRGVVVPDGAGATAQLTIHGDHFFYDDLTSPDASLRFQNLADADDNDDGEVTLEELAAVSLSSLSTDNGPYEVASASVTDLRAYLTTAMQTLGHFNGEGHCEIE